MASRPELDQLDAHALCRAAASSKSTTTGQGGIWT